MTHHEKHSLALEGLDFEQPFARHARRSQRRATIARKHAWLRGMA